MRLRQKGSGELENFEEDSLCDRYYCVSLSGRRSAQIRRFCRRDARQGYTVLYGGFSLVACGMYAFRTVYGRQTFTASEMGCGTMPCCFRRGNVPCTRLSCNYADYSLPDCRGCVYGIRSDNACCGVISPRCRKSSRKLVKVRKNIQACGNSCNRSADSSGCTRQNNRPQETADRYAVPADTGKDELMMRKFLLALCAVMFLSVSAFGATMGELNALASAKQAEYGVKQNGY